MILKTRNSVSNLNKYYIYTYFWLKIRKYNENDKYIRMRVDIKHEIKKGKPIFKELYVYYIGLKIED